MRNKKRDMMKKGKKVNKKSKEINIKKKKKKKKMLVGWFVWFYCISTIVGYLTPNPFLCK